MPERRIPCPECDGTGLDADNPGVFACDTCKGHENIPDRRKPTANDSALNRIVARCEGSDTGTICYVEICAIIREEAERHE